MMRGAVVGIRSCGFGRWRGFLPVGEPRFRRGRIRRRVGWRPGQARSSRRARSGWMSRWAASRRIFSNVAMARSRSSRAVGGWICGSGRGSCSGARGGCGSGLLLFEGDGPVFVGDENICQRARLGFGEVGSIKGVACVEDEVLPFGEFGRVDAEFFGSCLKSDEGGHDAVAAVEGRRGGSSRLGNSALGGSGLVLRCEVEIDPIVGRGVDLEFEVERFELRELDFHFLKCLYRMPVRRMPGQCRILGEAPVCGWGRFPGARRGSGRWCLWPCGSVRRVCVGRRARCRRAL